MPDDLPAALEGSFGWSGTETAQKPAKVLTETIYALTTRTRTSLYLASGFPLVVWKESALAHFVLDKECGLAVDSLHDLQKVLDD